MPEQGQSGSTRPPREAVHAVVEAELDDLGSPGSIAGITFRPNDIVVDLVVHGGADIPNRRLESAIDGTFSDIPSVTVTTSPASGIWLLVDAFRYAE